MNSQRPCRPGAFLRLVPTRCYPDNRMPAWTGRLLWTIVTGASLVAACADPATATGCEERLKSFDAAVAGQALGEARAIEGQIAIDGACGAYKDEVQRQRAILELRLARQRMEAGAPLPEYEALVMEAERPGVLWRASVGLADIRFTQRRFVEAAEAYERAIEIIKSPSKTPERPGDPAIRAVLDRAAESRLLASSGEVNGGKSVFVPAARDNRSGTVGGSLSEAVRGFAIEAVPVPIQFETDSVTFTPVGEQAARELLEAIRDQNPAEITIVGHTDERGGDDYNLRLSGQRAKAVADYLRRNGVTARIAAVARGEAEPVQLSGGQNLSQEDIWALNRRVVWKRN